MNLAYKTIWSEGKELHVARHILSYEANRLSAIRKLNKEITMGTYKNYDAIRPYFVKEPFEYVSPLQRIADFWVNNFFKIAIGMVAFVFITSALIGSM